MILLLLIIGGLLFAGVLVFVVFGGLFKVESDQKKAEQNAEQLLDETFDGRADVTYTTTMRSLKYETVIMGAKARGYALTHQAAQPYGALIFEKTS